MAAESWRCHARRRGCEDREGHVRRGGHRAVRGGHRKGNPGIVAELSKDLDDDQELSLDDLEHVAGGRGGRYRSSSCS